MTTAEGPILLGDSRFRCQIEVWPKQLLEEFGPRFDNTATVQQVWLGVQAFLVKGGLMDEFGIDGVGVLGYSEAEPGEAFLKIGVGRLVRSDRQDYKFWNRYETKDLLPVHVRHGVDFVEVCQQAELSNHYGYEYTKRYRVFPASRVLTICYHLENTGTRPFRFNQYNHNWLATPSTLTAPESSVPGFLETAFGVENAVSAQWLTPSYGVTLPHRFEIEQPNGAPRFFESKQGAPARSNRLLVRLPATGYRATGHRVEISGNFPLARFALYAEPSALCPEIFMQGDLQPGEARNWTRFYRFTSGTGPESSSFMGPHRAEPASTAPTRDGEREARRKHR